jgi:hypothetical protein
MPHPPGSLQSVRAWVIPSRAQDEHGEIHGDTLPVVGSRNGRREVDAEELGAGLLRAQAVGVQPGSVCAAQRAAGHTISITTRSTTGHGNLRFSQNARTLRLHFIVVNTLKGFFSTTHTHTHTPWGISRKKITSACRHGANRGVARPSEGQGSMLDGQGNWWVARGARSRLTARVSLATKCGRASTGSGGAIRHFYWRRPEAGILVRRCYPGNGLPDTAAAARRTTFRRHSALV